MFPFAAAPTQIFQTVTATRLQLACLLLLSTWMLLQVVDATANTLAARAPRARFFFKGISPIARFVVYFGVAYALIAIFAPTAETRLTLLASSGLAIGLGAQDLIKDLIAGIVILADRPFQLGDRVKIQDAYGEIDQIGLRSTKLTTADDTRVTIANSTLIGGLVWNSNGGVPDCQVSTDLLLPIDVDLEVALKIGYESAYSSPYLLRSKPVVVLLSDQFDQMPYLRLRIKAYVFDHRYEPRLMSDITLRAKRAFQARGLLRDWRRLPE